MDDTHDDLPRKQPDGIDHLTGQTGPHAALEDDQEVVYYEGSPLLRGELGLVLIWIVVGLVLILGPVAWMYYGNPPGSYLWLIAIPIGIACMFIPALWVKRNRYKITNYRIDHEFGLLSKNYDTLELWHVNDVSMRQGPVDRIFGVGTISIESDDRSTPHLELRSLAKPRQLLESLKQRVIAVKRQRGVIKMDMGG